MMNATKVFIILLGCMLSIPSFGKKNALPSLKNPRFTISKNVDTAPANHSSFSYLSNSKSFSSCITPPLPEVSDIIVCEGQNTEIIPTPTSVTQSQAFEVKWDFEGQTTTGVSNQAGVNPTNAKAGSGLGNIGFVDGFNGGDAYVGDSWTSGTNEFFEYCVTVPSGTMDITGVTFRARRSSTGPGSIVLNQAVNGSATYTPASSNMSLFSQNWFVINRDIDFATGVTSFCFRIEAISNASDEQGTLRVDDFIIKGNLNETVDVGFNFYDANPGTGPANLLAGPTASYDPGTNSTNSPQLIWVTSINNICESAAASVSVTIKSRSTPLTNVSASKDIVCQGQSSELTASGGTSGVGSSIEWYTGPNGTGTNFASGPGPHTVSPSIPTTYYVRREGDCNATMDASVMVGIGSNITVDAGPDQTVYVGYAPQASATLTATAIGAAAPLSYLWSTGETTQSITVSPRSTTNYWVEVSDANGCMETDDIKVCAIDVRCKKRGHRNKILICHKFWRRHGHARKSTLCVSERAVAAHLAHGDQLGHCGANANCGGSNFVQTPDIDVSRIAVSPADAKISAAPNPFSSQVVLSLQVPKTGYVRLDIVNFAGQFVALPFEGTLEAGVIKQVEFSGLDLPAGIYIARLHTAAGIVPIKLVLSN